MTDIQTVRSYRQDYKPSGMSPSCPDMAPDRNKKLSDGNNKLWSSTVTIIVL
jgi:hypothetical protein